MKRITLLAGSLAVLATLGACGKGANKPKTAVLGERIPVLGAHTGVEIEAAIADVPVAAPEAVANAAWAQPGGSADKAMGHLALGAQPVRVWATTIAGDAKGERLVSAPVVADGRLYVVDAAAVVHAYDARTGAPVWQAAISTGKENRHSFFGGGVSFDNGQVFATSGLGDVVALDAATGKEVWKKHPGGPLRGAPTIGAGSIYVLAQDNQIFALRQDNGATAWTAAATLVQAGVVGVGAPAYAQGTVVAGFSSGELTAFRYENGREVWQDALTPTSISTSVSSLSDIDASPVIEQGRVYAVGQGGRMVALELTTGQRLWEINIGGIATPWVAGEWLFVVTDEGRLVCIAKTTGKVRWIADLPRWRNAKKKTGAIGWYGPVLAGGRLLLTNTRGELVSVGLEKGDVQSTLEAGASFNLGPVVADSMLYLLDNKGRLSAWR